MNAAVGRLGRVANPAASTAFQIAGATLSLSRSRPSANCPFVHVAEQFDASDRVGSGGKILEAKHGPSSGFDTSMILLDEVVQVLRGPQVSRAGSRPSSRISRTARWDAA
jgi:hypothetical protein